MELMNGWGLVALQGPQAAQVLQSLTDYDLKQLTFGKSAWVEFKEGGFSKLHVARAGYTGEDGFEVRAVYCLYNYTPYLRSVRSLFHLNKQRL
jgi:aminomethyltransferase